MYTYTYVYVNIQIYLFISVYVYIHVIWNDMKLNDAMWYDIISLGVGLVNSPQKNKRLFDSKEGSIFNAKSRPTKFQAKKKFNSE